jgi:acyl-[acyl carrier protein]--UDP-N-acetylglucosamine O-acyltransferase
MLIYGAGRLGQQALHLLNTHFAGRCSVAGFVDDRRPPGEVVTSHYRVLGDLETVARFPATAPARVCLVPALEPGDQPARGHALARARRLGYSFPILVHPDACVEPGSVLGAGVIVEAGALVSRSVRVGDFCHLDPGVIVGPGSRLDENVHLAAGVTVGERVLMGCDCAVGLHATIADRLSVADGTVVPPHALLDGGTPRQRRLARLASLSRGSERCAVVFDEVSHA